MRLKPALGPAADLPPDTRTKSLKQTFVGGTWLGAAGRVAPVWGSARPPKSGRVIHNSQGRSSSAGRALMSSAGRISAAAGPRHATKEPGAWPGSMVIQGYRANADLTGNLPTARSPARRRSQQTKSPQDRIRSVATGPCRSSHARLRSLCCSARDPNFGNGPSTAAQ